MNRSKIKYYKEEKKLLKQLYLNRITINDLKDRYYKHLPLTEEQVRAIKNFDAVALEALQAENNEEDYNKKYMLLQAMSNLYDYKEFIR